MAQCISCGAELHPERAKKYNYCMAQACQEKNVKGLTIVAVGMNKAADELVILDEHTREELASGRYADQRRGFFGRPVRSAGTACVSGPDAGKAPEPEPVAGPAGGERGGRPAPTARPAPPAPHRPWSLKQERLALLYNEQGLRPRDIAQKLGVSSYLVTQIILSARNRGKA